MGDNFLLSCLTDIFKKYVIVELIEQLSINPIIETKRKRAIPLVQRLVFSRFFNLRGNLRNVKAFSSFLKSDISSLLKTQTLVYFLADFLKYLKKVNAFFKLNIFRRLRISVISSSLKCVSGQFFALFEEIRHIFMKRPFFRLRLRDFTNMTIVRSLFIHSI